MKRFSKRSIAQALCTLCMLSAFATAPAISQDSTAGAQPVQKKSQTQDKEPEKKPELPAALELLETKVRFEANGDSRKEVHTLVHINNELGVRQFARLSFDYNRSFQQVELPLVRITHVSGGTADILPSAISDQPNPAVINAPAYQDVRVKSIRILGLEPGDRLEYRVVTTNRPNPFVSIAHDFARDNSVAEEIFEINLPAASLAEPVTSSAAREYETSTTSEGSDARVVYRWELLVGSTKERSSTRQAFPVPRIHSPQFDVVLSMLRWSDFPLTLKKAFHLDSSPPTTIVFKAQELTHNCTTPSEKLGILYDFVSSKVRTIDLPVGATGFRLREPGDVLASGYATPEDKAMLLSFLTRSVGVDTAPGFVLRDPQSLQRAVIPEYLTNVLVVARLNTDAIWLDPSVEVAPFGVVSSSLRGKPALLLAAPNDVQFFEKVSARLPFPAIQRVNVEASIAADGGLKAKVKYALRGDNELLLRVAFHQAPKDKWKDVAQLLALSDGFRGKVSSVTASDPYATKEPFTVEYEITQPKFVDWSKNPVRIPAVLPLIGLPEASAKASEAAEPGSSVIDLGTPLDVEARVTLRVPPNTGVRAPVGTSVQRDYSTFASEYSAHNLTLTAVRHIKFLHREVPAAEAPDYAAFVRSVQNDQAQEFTLERGDSAPSARAARAKKD